MRTFDRKDIYTIANAKEARKYVGQDGFFSDDFKDMIRKVAANIQPTILQLIEVNGDFPFIDNISDNPNQKTNWRYFLPADKVKDDGKRYREIDTYKEFIAVTGVDLGKILTIRLRDNPEIETSGILSSIVECKNKLQGVDIGGASYTMHDLYKRYEFYNVNDSEWSPFCLEVV